jgi:RNA polymerase sigma factor (sigma-70 family)
VAKLGTFVDDAALEQLFEGVRRYALLTAEEEKAADSRKWQAADRIMAHLAADAASRIFLVQWLEACLLAPPDVGSIGNREQYFMLRRELSDMAGEDALSAALSRLRSAPKAAEDASALSALKLPATMAVALAEAAMADDVTARPAGIAGALCQWRTQWPAPEARREQKAPSRRTARVLNQCIAEYHEARDVLVAHNLRLVCSIAGNYTGQGLSYPDLVHEGTFGLIRAAEKYHHERGYRFSTYAYNWIAQAVRRGVQDSGEIIRYPGHVQEKLSRIYGERARLLAVTGREPADAEVAEALGLGSDQVRQLMQLRNRGISLDAPRYGDEEGSTFLDGLPDDTFDPAPRDAERRSLLRFLMTQIERLDPSEQHVVVRRWGLDEQRPLSRAEIADQLSVSREWIRQLERSALDKLGQYIENEPEQAESLREL